MHGEFTWVDLSALDLDRAVAFYGHVLGWRVVEDAAGYLTCAAGPDPCAGLFPMPEFFRRIKMPSFWMTYIAVDDLEGVVAKAKQLGAKVELEDVNALGRIALIRDPAGAGFTCYQGDAPSAIDPRRTPGRWAWSELFVSDLGVVKPFYESLFGWKLVADERDPDRHAIHTAAGKRIGAVQVVSDDVKGPKQYWAVFFAVASIERALEDVRSRGGEVLFTHTNADGTHHLIQDPQGAACYVTESCARVATAGPGASPGSASPRWKWRAVLGLLIVYIAVVTNASWVWGVLFLLWVIPDLRSGTTYVIEPLDRRREPLLYWAVVGTWLWLSMYMLSTLFVDA
ncbi:MAG: VOC family protein [Planctomycetota bacterium]